MKNEYKTIEELKKEIDVLSAAKNRHQLGVENESKKLKNIKKEVAEYESEAIEAVKAKRKAIDDKKKKESERNAVMDSIPEFAIKLEELKELTEKEQKKLDSLNDYISKAESQVEKKKEEIDSRIAKYKQAIVENYDKIKELL